MQRQEDKLNCLLSCTPYLCYEYKRYEEFAFIPVKPLCLDGFIQLNVLYSKFQPGKNISASMITIIFSVSNHLHINVIQLLTSWSSFPITRWKATPVAAVKKNK